MGWRSVHRPQHLRQRRQRQLRYAGRVCRSREKDCGAQLSGRKERGRAGYGAQCSRATFALLAVTQSARAPTLPPGMQHCQAQGQEAAQQATKHRPSARAHPCAPVTLCRQQSRAPMERTSMQPLRSCSAAWEARPMFSEPADRKYARAALPRARPSTSGCCGPGEPTLRARTRQGEPEVRPCTRVDKAYRACPLQCMTQRDLWQQGCFEMQPFQRSGRHAGQTHPAAAQKRAVSCICSQCASCLFEAHFAWRVPTHRPQATTPPASMQTPLRPAQKSQLSHINFVAACFPLCPVELYAGQGSPSFWQAAPKDTRSLQ